MEKPGPCSLPFVNHSVFFPLTTLFEEIACTLRDDEHLLDELPSVRLLSLLDSFLQILRPDESSCSDAGPGVLSSKFVATSLESSFFSILLSP